VVAGFATGFDVVFAAPVELVAGLAVVCGLATGFFVPDVCAKELAKNRTRIRVAIFFIFSFFLMVRIILLCEAKTLPKILFIYIYSFNK
jgi:hypothetical protein